MSLYTLVLAVATASGVAIGQVLFKLAAARGGLGQILISSYFWFACCLYGLVTIVWVLLLKEMDLSRAYPILAACYVLVPAMSVILLGERVGLSYVIGVLLIVSGIFLTAR
jgi:drug/metabolite transporter (DMT)-like permease